MEAILYFNEDSHIRQNPPHCNEVQQASITSTPYTSVGKSLKYDLHYCNRQTHLEAKQNRATEQQYDIKENKLSTEKYTL